MVTVQSVVSNKMFLVQFEYKHIIDMSASLLSYLFSKE